MFKSRWSPNGSYINYHQIYVISHGSSIAINQLAASSHDCGKTMKNWNAKKQNIVGPLNFAKNHIESMMPCPDARYVEYFPTCNHIDPKNDPNVGKYSIHGASGLVTSPIAISESKHRMSAVPEARDPSLSTNLRGCRGPVSKVPWPSNVRLVFFYKEKHGKTEGYGFQPDSCEWWDASKQSNVGTFELWSHGRYDDVSWNLPRLKVRFYGCFYQQFSVNEPRTSWNQNVPFLSHSFSSFACFPWSNQMLRYPFNMFQGPVYLAVIGASPRVTKLWQWKTPDVWSFQSEWGISPCHAGKSRTLIQDDSRTPWSKLGYVILIDCV